MNHSWFSDKNTSPANWDWSMPKFPSWTDWFGTQARRGDIRPMVLRALLEKPMHGYEVMCVLEEKNHGMWRPSPGSIYPMLQLLEDEGLVTLRTENGKKVYALSDEGREAANQTEPEVPWQAEDLARIAKIQEVMFELMGTFKRITYKGSEDDFKAAQSVIDEATGKLKDLIGQHDK